MQPSPHTQLDKWVRLDRLRLVATWCLGLGLVALAFAFMYVGGGGIANPKTWASAHSAFAAAGGLRWLIVPLIGAGLVLFVVGGILCVFLSKREG
jgi:hypothetical protein